MNRTQLYQFLRFLLVGVMNSLVTLGVIVLCKSVLGINPYLSNLLGYIAGVVNSFIWNKTWVFHSNGKITAEASRFLLGWGICYSLQLLIVWALQHPHPTRRNALAYRPLHSIRLRRSHPPGHVLLHPRQLPLQPPHRLPPLITRKPKQKNAHLLSTYDFLFLNSNSLFSRLVNS